MKLLTKESVEKAEGDFATATREIRVRKTPNHDAVCFHSQQCAEKYLKALLQEAEVPFGKTHHLVSLLDLLLNVAPPWELLKNATGATHFT
jgi:HEPN domain-containing protein